jgi:hypothetical protein
VRFFSALFVVLQRSAPAFLSYFRGMSMYAVPKEFFGRILFSVTVSVSFFICSRDTCWEWRICAGAAPSIPSDFLLRDLLVSIRCTW